MKHKNISALHLSGEQFGAGFLASTREIRLYNEAGQVADGGLGGFLASRTRFLLEPYLHAMPVHASSIQDGFLPAQGGPLASHHVLHYEFSILQLGHFQAAGVLASALRAGLVPKPNRFHTLGMGGMDGLHTLHLEHGPFARGGLLLTQGSESARVVMLPQA